MENKPTSIADLLSSPERWTQRSAARNQAKEATWPNDASACCWCLWGAIQRIYGIGYMMDDIVARIHRHLESRDEHRYITYWNDAPERQYEEVKALVEELKI